MSVASADVSCERFPSRNMKIRFSCDSRIKEKSSEKSKIFNKLFIIVSSQIFVFQFYLLYFFVFFCVMWLLPQKLSFLLWWLSCRWDVVMLVIPQQIFFFVWRNFALVAKGHIKESYICFCVWKIARILFRSRSTRSCPTLP